MLCFPMELQLILAYTIFISMEKGREKERDEEKKKKNYLMDLVA